MARGLPVPVARRILPGLSSINRLPVFRNSKGSVACIHVLFDKALVARALRISDYTVQRMAPAGDYAT